MKSEAIPFTPLVSSSVSYLFIFSNYVVLFATASIFQHEFFCLIISRFVFSSCFDVGTFCYIYIFNLMFRWITHRRFLLKALIYLFFLSLFCYSKDSGIRPSPPRGESPFLTQIRTQQTFSTIFVPREMSRQFEREVRFPTLSSFAGSRDHGSRISRRSSL